MKLYKVEFKPIWPVGGALIILANDVDEATRIANETITHEQAQPIKVIEIDMSEPGVVIYLSGDY